jgi:ParB-like chromosome segregation protein Spo0J
VAWTEVTRSSGQARVTARSVARMGSASSTVEVALGALGERLRALRLGGEDAVTRMADSLARHGQLTAVTAFAPAQRQLELCDGFKRLAAARRLDWATLRVDVLELDLVQAKVALVQLNQASALSELEEAWLVRSLYRDDRLVQPVIARLLQRHKSWVCRRLALATGLDDAVEADVRLGLLAARAASEVTRLPRGNQRAVAEVVVRRGLTVAQTAQLVTALGACTDEAARRTRLRQAEEGPGTPPARATRRAPTPAEQLVGDIGALRRRVAQLQARLLAAPLAALGAAAAAHVTRELAALAPVLAALDRTITDVRGGAHAPLA